MQRTRVLIVDDHAEVISGLRQLLETDEATEVVGSATSGGQAIEQAKALRPDVVLMDFSLTDMDGLEAARIIRSQGSEAQVVILSVYEPAEYAQRVAEAGVRRWIPKSQQPDVLLSELRELSEELRQSWRPGL